jgi:hypothetical protein
MLTEVSAWDVCFISMLHAPCISLNLFGILQCCQHWTVRWRVRIHWQADLQGLWNLIDTSLQDTFLVAATIFLVIFFWVWSTILIVTRGLHIRVRTLSKESACCKSNLWYFLRFNGDCISFWSLNNTAPWIFVYLFVYYVIFWQLSDSFTFA